jgi:hypothetical protein
VSMAARKILRADKRRKVTLNLTIGTDALLSVLAKIRGSDRSAEAERLILAGRADVAITLHGKDYRACGGQELEVA